MARMADMKLVFNVPVVHGMFVVSGMTELQPGSNNSVLFFLSV